MNQFRSLTRMAKHNSLSLVFFIAFMLQASLASAAVIYDEAIDGDMLGAALVPDVVNSGTSAGPLSNGSNTVLGTTFFEKLDPRNGTPFTWDRDHFNFSLSGTATVSFLYRVISLTQTNSSVGVDFRLFNGPTASPIDPGFFTPLATGNTYFIAPITLLAGNYQMYSQSASLGFGGSGRVDWTYSWEMNVVGLPNQVPEPASIFLLILGMAFVGISRRARNISR